MFTLTFNNTHIHLIFTLHSFHTRTYFHSSQLYTCICEPIPTCMLHMYALYVDLVHHSFFNFSTHFSTFQLVFQLVSTHSSTHFSTFQLIFQLINQLINKLIHLPTYNYISMNYLDSLSDKWHRAILFH